MAAGLKTIIALSFVINPPFYSDLEPTNTVPGPRHWLPPRNPLFRPLEPIPPSPRRSYLRPRAAAQLPLQPLLVSR